MAHALEKVNRYDEAEDVFSDLIRRRPGNSQHLACGGKFPKNAAVSPKRRPYSTGRSTPHTKGSPSSPTIPSRTPTSGWPCKRRGNSREHCAPTPRGNPSGPESAFARGLLGRALADRGESDAAIAELRQAARLLPNDAVIHYYLGCILAERQRTEEAVTELQKAIELEPDVAVNHHALGTALSQQGKVEEGVEQFRAAIRLKPDLAESHCRSGPGTWSQGRGRRVLRAGQAPTRSRVRVEAAGLEVPPSADWVREAEHLAALAGRLPAILSGDDRPKDNAERLGLARVCYITKRFVAAARFGAAALEANRARPGPSGDAPLQRRLRRRPGRRGKGTATRPRTTPQRPGCGGKP